MGGCQNNPLTLFRHKKAVRSTYQYHTNQHIIHIQQQITLYVNSSIKIEIIMRTITASWSYEYNDIRDFHTVSQVLKFLMNS